MLRTGRLTVWDEVVEDILDAGSPRARADSFAAEDKLVQRVQVDGLVHRQEQLLGQLRQCRVVALRLGQPDRRVQHGAAI